ncbi:MAG: hypothetical protein PHO00_02895 [bacterium]|nr:hypothetical protein [bacterium]
MRLNNQYILIVRNAAVLLLLLALFGYMLWGKFYSSEAILEKRIRDIKRILESKNIGSAEKMLSEDYRDDLGFDKITAVNYMSSVFKNSEDIKIFMGDVNCIFEGEKVFVEIRAEYRIRTKDYLFTNVLSAGPDRNVLRVVFDGSGGQWVVSEVKNFREFFDVRKHQAKSYF